MPVGTSARCPGARSTSTRANRSRLGWTGTLATGSVVLSELNEKVAAAGTQEALDQVKAELEAGTRHVFDITTFTVEGKQLDSYMADVDTDPDYTPDTEAIKDGEEVIRERTWEQSFPRA